MLFSFMSANKIIRTTRLVPKLLLSYIHTCLWLMITVRYQKTLPKLVLLFYHIKQLKYYISDKLNKYEMSHHLSVDGVEYIEHKPESEKELEDYIQKFASQIFDEDIIYLSVKTKLKSPSGIGSIPDAYALKLNPLKWSIIEVELSTHPLFNHIVPQLNKFAQGLKEQQSRKHLVETFYDAIKRDPFLETTVKQEIGSGEIHRTLTNLIDQPPSLIVIIDKKTKELEEACDSIPIQEKKVMEFKIYKRKDSGLITAFLFNTIKDHKSKLTTKPEPTHEKPKGLPIFFTYKKQKYDATWIDRNKITYQGKDYTSPSALSVEITGTPRNGWRDWKFIDKNGEIKSIEELR